MKLEFIKEVVNNQVTNTRPILDEKQAEEMNQDCLLIVKDIIEKYNLD